MLKHSVLRLFYYAHFWCIKGYLTTILLQILGT